MRNATVFMIVLVSSSLFAQSPLEKQVLKACPVGFVANVSGRAIAHTVNDSGGVGGQLLEISFSRNGSEEIVSATVAVHGMAGGERVMPVKNGAPPEAGDVQIFQFNKLPREREVSQSEVWVTKLSGVAWSEITELQFADGSVWHASKESQCVARPSLLKLVNATAH